MAVKEYLLRKTINQQLNYTNFNTFLNTYRINDACEILADTSKKDLTILEIAYDLGFTSIATFNRAFKKLKNQTPTAYRNQNEA